MALLYDFDMFEVVPSTLNDDPELRGFMVRSGLIASSEPRKLALFREEATVEALRNAPAQIRDYFLASGFGLNSFRSGAPRGHYPAADEADRLQVIEQLTENAPRYDLPVPGEAVTQDGMFSLADFLEHLAQAVPVALPVQPVHPVDAVSPATLKSREGHDESAASGGVSVVASLASRLLRGVPRLAQFRRQ